MYSISIYGAQCSIFPSFWLLCDHMVEVQARALTGRKCPGLMRYPFFTEETLRQVHLANSCSLQIILLHSHGFCVSFLGIEPSVPKWVSTMGDWIKTSWIMSVHMPHVYLTYPATLCLWCCMHIWWLMNNLCPRWLHSSLCSMHTCSTYQHRIYT
jgi:hypothetical protein